MKTLHEERTVIYEERPYNGKFTKMFSKYFALTITTVMPNPPHTDIYIKCGPYESLQNLYSQLDETIT